MTISQRVICSFFLAPFKAITNFTVQSAAIGQEKGMSNSTRPTPVIFKLEFLSSIFGTINHLKYYRSVSLWVFLGIIPHIMTLTMLILPHGLSSSLESHNERYL